MSDIITFLEGRRAAGDTQLSYRSGVTEVQGEVVGLRGTVIVMAPNTTYWMNDGKTLMNVSDTSYFLVGSGAFITMSKSEEPI